MEAALVPAFAVGIPLAARRARRVRLGRSAALPGARTTRPPARVRAARDNKNSNNDNADESYSGTRDGDDEEKDTDWDTSWAEYRATSAEKGGVFGVRPPSGPPPPPPTGTGPGPAGDADRFRAENRITDVWTSEAAFLGFAVLLLGVACLYAYVLLSGELS